MRAQVIVKYSFDDAYNKIDQNTKKQRCATVGDVGDCSDNNDNNICSNNNINTQIHAYDRCKGKIDYKNCLHHACTEVSSEGVDTVLLFV
jgi:hypothetical protein